MRKVKLFLEFVIGNKKSLFTEMTYDDISKKLGCSVDEVEEFEDYLDQNMTQGETFYGSLDVTSHDDHDENRDAIDKIETWEDYAYMWDRYQDSLTSQASHSHSDDGL